MTRAESWMAFGDIGFLVAFVWLCDALCAWVRPASRAMAINANLDFSIGECEFQPNGHSTTRAAEVDGACSEVSLVPLLVGLGFFCERFCGAPFGISLRDHDVEDGLATLFGSFNQV